MCGVFSGSDGKEYALKLIEGTGISMSACREIAVSTILFTVLIMICAVYMFQDAVI